VSHDQSFDSNLDTYMSIEVTGTLMGRDRGIRVDGSVGTLTLCNRESRSDVRMEYHSRYALSSTTILPYND
jgi:hypothetical protein